MSTVVVAVCFENTVLTVLEPVAVENYSQLLLDTTPHEAGAGPLGGSAPAPSKKWLVPLQESELLATGWPLSLQRTPSTRLEITKRMV